MANGFFNVVSYTGNGGTQSITSIGFQPDLIIFSGPNGCLSVDSTNGTGKITDMTATAGTAGPFVNRVTSFDTNGFSIGSATDVNGNGSAYVAFCWAKGSLCDIKIYTGNGTTQNISHNLGITPQSIFITNAPASFSPILYNVNLGATSPQTHVDSWANSGVTTSVDINVWNSAAPTSSVFSVGASGLSNTNANSLNSYLFGQVTNISAFGTYTGNGSASGPMVSGLGFTPQLVMVTKQVATLNNLGFIYGNTKSITLNTGATDTTTNIMDLVSGGFNLKTATNFNTNLTVYSYAAFAKAIPSGGLIPFISDNFTGNMQELVGGIHG